MPSLDLSTRAGAAPAETACAHCGLPVPPAFLSDDGGSSFCCSGCHTAFEILRAGGLERYYDLPERRSSRVVPSGRSFEEFDHPSFHELYVRGVAGGECETRLYLEGVQCASCVWLLERVPLTLPGLAASELDLTRSLVRLRWDPAQVRLSRVAQFLDELGYAPHPFRGLRVEAARRAEDRAAVARIGVAGALAGNVMLVAVALYSGWFGNMDRGLSQYFRWVSLLLTTPALLWPGRVFFRGAWSSLRLRALHMDVPIAIALAAGFTRGAVNTVAGQGPIYFDGVAMLIFLLLVGRFLQSRAQRAAADSAELLHSLAPGTARVVEGDCVREMPSEGLLPGMVLEVRAGDTLAADGTILEGRSDLDLSLLTGESRPTPVGPGERVFAGTLNATSTLRVLVEQAGEASRLGRMLREVEAGAARRAPVVREADRLSGIFVTTVLALALGTLLYWLRVRPEAAVDNAIALLIVTCPCALALATPLAVTVAIGRAARCGILVKGGDVLETLSRPAAVLLDKTGTLSEGRTALAEWDGPEALQGVVLGLERHSSHPLARGFAEAWSGVVAADARDVRTHPGGGLTGWSAGHHYAIGSPRFVTEMLGTRPGDAPRPGTASGAPRVARETGNLARFGAAASARPDLSPVWVAADGALAARAAFGDPVRADAAHGVAELRRLGFAARIVSGDAQEVVTLVGARLGLAPELCLGGVTPEGKVAIVEAALADGPVVMVGDGVNDAAAMARASVGVGVRGGAEACLAAADVFMTRPGMTPVVELVEGSRRTMHVIRRNIAFSLAYNLAGAALAMAGLINPLAAAVLMPVSSLTVVLASWRSRTFVEESR